MHAENDATKPSKEPTAQAITTTDASAPSLHQVGVEPDDYPGYHVLGELSRGGQGVVYLAHQFGTDRKVAIKVLVNAELASPTAQLRFSRELQIASRLKHPNIITIFHSGTSKHQQRFFVMDYVEGQPLDRYVKEHGLLLPDLLRLFIVVCRSVSYAHQRGVIHRDLKPSNILVDGAGTPKLLDFGLARDIEGDDFSISEPGQVFGSFPYMAPEQAAGDTVNVSIVSDVYALGVILYKLITGQFPFSVSGTHAQIIQAILNSEPLSPRSAWQPDSGVPIQYARFTGPRSGIARDLELILLKTLRKSPADRYATVDALADDLERYLDGRPIAARQGNTAYVLRKTFQRHRVAASILGLLLISLGAAASLVIEARFERDQSREVTAEVDRLLLEKEKQLLSLFAGEHEPLIRRMKLGWALLTLQNEPDSASALARDFPAESSEAALFTALANPMLSLDELRTSLPAKDVYLVTLAAAERARRAGEAADALAQYRALAATARDPWLRRYAQTQGDSLDRKLHPGEQVSNSRHSEPSDAE